VLVILLDTWAPGWTHADERRFPAVVCSLAQAGLAAHRRQLDSLCQAMARGMSALSWSLSSTVGAGQGHRAVVSRSCRLTKVSRGAPCAL
jgi:hypothetical protein